MNPSRSFVAIVDLHKSFGGTPVLRGIDLSVSRGEVVCLLGSSGAGKSTLLRCINGLNMPERGYVQVDGTLIGRKIRDNRLVDLRNRQASRQRQNIGMVFQEFNLFPHLDVLDNLLLTPSTLRRGAKEDLEGTARSLLERVGLSDRAGAFPAQLSGGQQQRVAIARALMMNPSLMLFDEPTSALDPKLTLEVLETMQALAREGMSMIVVTHEMAFARKVADRIVFMAGGLVVEDAAPARFFEAPESTEARSFLGSEAQDAR